MYDEVLRPKYHFVCHTDIYSDLAYYKANMLLHAQS